MEQHSKNHRVMLLVLNDFLKFDRKIYQLFGLNLGRPIKLKTIIYFLAILLLEIAVYFTPIVGLPLRMMPQAFLVLLPGFLAYLLSDIPAEGRTPLAYIRSFVLYHYRKLKKVTYTRGREVKKPSQYVVSGYATIKKSEKAKHFKGRKFKIRPRISITNE